MREEEPCWQGNRQQNQSFPHNYADEIDVVLRQKLSSMAQPFVAPVQQFNNMRESFRSAVINTLQTYQTGGMTWENFAFDIAHISVRIEMPEIRTDNVIARHKLRYLVQQHVISEEDYTKCLAALRSLPQPRQLAENNVRDALRAAVEYTLAACQAGELSREKFAVDIAYLSVDIESNSNNANALAREKLRKLVELQIISQETWTMSLAQLRIPTPATTQVDIATPATSSAAAFTSSSAYSDSLFGYQTPPNTRSIRLASNTPALSSLATESRHVRNVYRSHSVVEGDVQQEAHHRIDSNVASRGLTPLENGNIALRDVRNNESRAGVEEDYTRQRREEGVIAKKLVDPSLEWSDLLHSPEEISLAKQYWDILELATPIELYFPNLDRAEAFVQYIIRNIIRASTYDDRIHTSNDTSTAKTNFNTAINVLKERIMDYLQSNTSYTNRTQQVTRSVFINPPPTTTRNNTDENDIYCRPQPYHVVRPNEIQQEEEEEEYIVRAASDTCSRYEAVEDDDDESFAKVEHDTL